MVWFPTWAVTVLASMATSFRAGPSAAALLRVVSGHEAPVKARPHSMRPPRPVRGERSEPSSREETYSSSDEGPTGFHRTGVLRSTTRGGTTPWAPLANRYLRIPSPSMSFLYRVESFILR